MSFSVMAAHYLVNFQDNLATTESSASRQADDCVRGIAIARLPAAAR